jgi:hypothetical protein
VSGGLPNAGPGESESTSFVDKKGEPINMDFDRHHAIAPQERRQPFSKNVLQMALCRKPRISETRQLPAHAPAVWNETALESESADVRERRHLLA